MRVLWLSLLLLVAFACVPPYGARHWPRSREAKPAVVLDVDADLADPARFFAAPFPAEPRLLPSGAPDVRGLPNPFGIPFVEASKAAVVDGVDVNGRGFAPAPVVSFLFDRVPAPLPIVPLTTLASTSGVQLVCLDDAHLGERVAVDVHVTQRADSARPAGLLQIAPLTGLALRPGLWAALVKRDADGDGVVDFDRGAGFAAALAGVSASAAWNAAYAPLRDRAADLDVDVRDLAAATVFSVSMPEARLTAHLRALRAGPGAPLVSVARGREDVMARAGLVELRGAVRQDQHQVGEPPHLFEGGTFAVSKAGEWQVTRTEEAPFVLTLPRGKMPAQGFPLLWYVHGTGGDQVQAIDRGPKARPGIPNNPGTGMASWLAPQGVATACVAGPYSPERIGDRALDGYGAYPFPNPAGMRDNFGQMLIEHVRFLRFLELIEIDAALVPEVDASAAKDGKIRFDTSRLVIAGHSLGSYLTGMLAGALDDVDGAVLSGAGGTWVEFAFGPKDPIDLQGVVETLALPPGEDLDRFHPFIDVFAFAAAAADNTLYTRHILRDVAGKRSAPHVLVVEGQPDAQVPTGLQRALVRSVGADFVGTDVGARSRDRLLPGIHAIGKAARAGAVVDNVTVDGVGPRTAVAVRYAEDGKLDGHSVLFQRKDTQALFVGFVTTVLAGGAPVVEKE